MNLGIRETAEFNIDVWTIFYDTFLNVEFIKSLVLISYLQSRQKTLNVLFFIFLLAFYYWQQRRSLWWS